MEIGVGYIPILTLSLCLGVHVQNTIYSVLFAWGGCFFCFCLQVFILQSKQLHSPTASTSSITKNIVLLKTMTFSGINTR